MSEVTAIQVSNYFINKAIDQERALTLMQVIKLTYIAQGFHLALENKPFFEGKIQAWKYGPVVEGLYEYLKRRSTGGVVIKQKQPSLGKFSDLQEDILSVVFKKYASISGWALSELTHRMGTPWSDAYKKEPDSIIEESNIKKHFEQIVNKISFPILLSEI